MNASAILSFFVKKCKMNYVHKNPKNISQSPNLTDIMKTFFPQNVKKFYKENYQHVPTYYEFRQLVFHCLSLTMNYITNS